MLPPLQAVYTRLTALAARVLAQVADGTMTPVATIFRQLATANVWSRVDVNAIHSLPSESSSRAFLT